MLLALLGYLAFLVWPGGGPEDDYPVLQQADQETQLGALLIGLAGLLAANYAVLRARRHGTEAHFGVLVLAEWRRTAAHALSVVPLALLVAVVVAGQYAREAARPHAVGNGSFFELATGPVLVLCFGALGVLLGKLVRSAYAAPMAAMVVISLTFVIMPTSGAARWLTPLTADEREAGPLPSDLLGRPADWHVLYLLGLTLLAAAGALLLSGGRTAVVRATAGALVLTVVGAVGQGVGPSDELTAERERATRDPAAAQQECVRHGVTTYCAFPEFTSWTGEWRKVADGVRALAGGEAAERHVTVRQRVYALDESGPGRELLPGPPGEVTADTTWGGERSLEFAASYARGLVADDESERAVYCDARSVLIMWLAVNGTPDGEDAFETTQSNVSGGGATILSPVNAVKMRDREHGVLRALLDRPREDVAQRVKDSWAELVRPGTSTERAAGLLGVKAPAETAADREWNCA
ncbi:ABC transporter permease [Streptomyces armeniacus]|uniref:ABC transporter permease n=1 Tax=Streptomyces armeniacus TaxID=83291 RepID=A0A345XYL9_9ACTN|nr:ABC transporter permease [Streptomyces armeniacus]AXK36735.1 ABC transporter permease [Streptomyces armeniacus]